MKKGKQLAKFRVHKKTRTINREYVRRGDWDSVEKPHAFTKSLTFING